MALHTLGVDSRKVGSLITGVLGFALILTALAILFKERLQSLGKVGAGSAWRERHVVPATIATGAVNRCACRIEFGLGRVRSGWRRCSGCFRCCPRRVSWQRYRARGSADCRGRSGHFYMGSVDWHLLGNLLIGSLPGIYLGSQLSGRHRRTLAASSARLDAGAGRRQAGLVTGWSVARFFKGLYMYLYDQVDRNLVNERVAQYRDQVRRFLPAT